MKLQQEQEALAKKEAQDKRREQRKIDEKDMRIPQALVVVDVCISHATDVHKSTAFVMMWELP